MRQELTLTLDGPTLERARSLAREAVTSIVLGGPSAEPSLEFVLTEATNSPAVGSTLLLVLASMVGDLAIATSEAELGPDVGTLPEDALRAGAASLVAELLDAMGEGSEG